MSFVVVIMLIVCIGIPLAFSWRVLRLEEPTKASWLLLVADAAVFVTLVLLVGRWDMAGYYARIFVLAVFLSAMLWSFKRHLPRPWRLRERSVLRQHWTTVFSLVLFGAALCYVGYGFVPPEKPRELVFPLEDGRFMVGQGGAISLLNHHASHREQRYGQISAR